MIQRDIYRRSIRHFLRPIATFLDDDSISEIMINSFDSIFVEQAGKLLSPSVSFTSADALLAALRNIAQSVGRPFDDDHPILEAHLPDGCRIEALLPPLSLCGPTASIRKFSKSQISVAQLVKSGALSAPALDLLSSLVAAKRNIIVAGGTGSGKTSLLNALSSLIPDGDRVIVIEDACELQLRGSHILQLQTRPYDTQGRGAVTVRDLFKATLRLRPDRIVIGEIRGEEALDLIQAMTSGHGGSMSTLHATVPRDTLSRLETMALMNSVELPLSALKTQIASALDIIVQTTRLPNGQRVVTHVSEVTSCLPQGDYELRDLFVRQPNSGSETSTLVATGALPSCLPTFQTALSSRIALGLAPRHSRP